MKNYPDWTTTWRSSRGSIRIVDLATDHLANIIDFVRWDAAKELNLVKTGPWSFDFAKFDSITRRRISSLVQAKVPMYWNLRHEAMKRGVFAIVENCKSKAKAKVARERSMLGAFNYGIDIETVRFRPPAHERVPGEGNPGQMGDPELMQALKVDVRTPTRRVSDLEKRVTDLEGRLSRINDDFEVWQGTVKLNISGLSTHRAELNALEKFMSVTKRQIKAGFARISKLEKPTK